MTTLRQHLDGVSKEVQANWPFYSSMFDQFLRDYSSSPAFTAGKSNEEIGIALKAVSDIREKIASSLPSTAAPTAPKIKKLSSITRINSKNA